MSVACEWFRRARKDLRAAEVLLREGLYEDAAYHSQQAVEKALKGLLIAHGVRPPYVHNIDHLLNLLKSYVDVSFLYEIDADMLTDYSVGARYPGPPVVEEEAREALRIAREAVEWARERLREKGLEC